MPVYTYEHVEKGACQLGAGFEVEHPAKAARLTACPACSRPVRRIITASFGIGTPKSDGDLRSAGFTKLVRRDDGVYENVTAEHGEKRIVRAGDPDGLAGLRKKIRD